MLGSASADSVDMTLLRAELEDLKRSKKDREEYILTLRKNLAETQNELQKASKLLVFVFLYRVSSACSVVSGM